MPIGFTDQRGLPLDVGDRVMISLPGMAEAEIIKASSIPEQHPQAPQGILKMEAIVKITFSVPFPGGGIGGAFKVESTEEQKAERTAKERAKPTLITQ